MTDLAKLVVRFEAETAKFRSEVTGLRSELASFRKTSNAAVSGIAKGIATAATVAAGAFVIMAKGAVDAADNLNDLSKSSGISAESLSQLGYAAKLSGTDLDGLIKGINRFSKFLQDAAEGGKGQTKVLKDLAISFQNADGSIRAVDDVLLDVADKFSKLQDGASKAALAQELFGKSGVALIPFLNQGRQGIEALKNEADQLGLTISGKTAQAADDFNDQLTTLKSIGQGLATQLVTQLLPLFTEIVGGLLDAAKAGGALDFAFKALSVTFKTLYSGAVIITSVFQQLGQIVYGVGAAIVRVAKGEFKLAGQEITDAFKKARDNVSYDIEKIVNVWSGAGAEIVETAKKTGEEARQALIPSGGLKLEELNITGLASKRFDKSAMEEYYERLDSLTQTSTERAVASYEEQKFAIRELYDAGIISAEQFAERSKGALDEFLPEFKVTVKKIEPELKKSYDALEEMGKEFARNTQDIIGDGLYQAFKGSSDDIVKAFGDMILRLSTQAAAAQLGKLLFGDLSSGGGGGSGGGTGLGGAFGALLSIFGGFRASGGPVETGKAYRVNENTSRSEWFVPTRPGNIIPNESSMWGRGDTIINVNMRSENGQFSRASATEAANTIARSLNRASRRNS